MVNSYGWLISAIINSCLETVLTSTNLGSSTIHEQLVYIEQLNKETVEVFGFLERCMSLLGSHSLQNQVFQICPTNMRYGVYNCYDTKLTLT